MKVSARLALAALLLASTLAGAGDRARIQDLRREGWDLVVKSGARLKAGDRFREALIRAERIDAIDLRVECVLDLLACFEDALESRPALRDAMGREALRLAARMGRHDLENRVLARLHSDDPSKSCSQPSSSAAETAPAGTSSAFDTVTATRATTCISPALPRSRGWAPRFARAR